VISELSFGPLYPSLLNPLDKTIASTETHFQRFQYYLSIVPTIYTTSRQAPVGVSRVPPSDGGAAGGTAGSDFPLSRSALRTNQYAVTSQSGPVPEYTVPGIFFKFDIEPILLTIMASRSSLLGLAVRVVNVVSGVLVGGGWIYQLWGWGRDVGGWKKGRGRSKSQAGGMLHGRKDETDEGEVEE
jgi:hypothetical protein